MTPFQEELFRLIQDSKKESNAFTSSEEDSGNEVSKIVKFADKWDYKDRHDKLANELATLNDRIIKELKIVNEKITRSLLKELAPIIDELFVLSRLIESGSTMERGFKITLSNLEKLLHRHGGGIIRPTVGEEMSPVKHKAIAAEEAPGHNGNTISEVYRYGYSALGQVIREAEVKVKCGTTKSK
jgi:molecular chaperone GrpE (heat shock protein)